MQKLASELLARNIISRQEGALVGTVQEIVINPCTGQFVGFLIKEGFGKFHIKALAEKDILGINNQFVLIPSHQSLGEVDEIVRIKEAKEAKVPIIKNKVVTLDGVYLGKVTDYSIDLKAARLSRLYIAPRAFRKIIDQYIINSSQIVSMSRDKIVVDDSCEKAKKKTAESLAGQRQTASEGI